MLKKDEADSVRFWEEKKLSLISLVPNTTGESNSERVEWEGWHVGNG